MYCGFGLAWEIDQATSPSRVCSVTSPPKMVVNAIFNIYPMMHQRYTRVRINRLLRLYPGRDGKGIGP